MLAERRGQRGYISEDQLPPGSPPSAAQVTVACVWPHPCSQAALPPKGGAISPSVSSGRHSSFPVCPLFPAGSESSPDRSWAGRTWRGPRHPGTGGGGCLNRTGVCGGRRDPWHLLQPLLGLTHAIGCCDLPVGSQRLALRPGRAAQSHSRASPTHLCSDGLKWAQSLPEVQSWTH